MPNNTNCTICSSTIKEDYLRKQYYQEDYPDILIGPYCSECFQKIRVCSGCQKPFVKDVDIKYYQKGLWYCTDCASHIESCDVCNSISAIEAVIDGKKICKSCLDKQYFYCNLCKKYHKKEENVFKYKVTEDPKLLKAKWNTLYKDYPAICSWGFSFVKDNYTPQAVSHCSNCSSVFSVAEMHNEKYCKYCWDTFYTCAVCKEKKPDVGGMSIDGISKKVCQSCASKLKRCDVCKNKTAEYTIFSGRIKDKVVCKRCKGNYEDNIKECPKCLCLFGSSTDGTPFANEDSLCYNCHSYRLCNKCNDILDFEGNCRSCGNSTRKIYSYSTKPLLSFNKVDNNYKDLFFGIENEQTYNYQEDRDRALSNIYKKFDPTILLCKSDGSISGPGFELVTQPMTLDFFNTLNTSIWVENTKPSSSCGMHIHLCRDSFASEVHILKLIQFIHDNAKLCNLVSGRDYNGYNNQLDKKPSRATKVGGTSRYCRVNTSGYSTIEIRMFSGCTNEFELKYRVEFTHAIWKFCKETSINSTKKEDLLAFIKKNSTTYPNIYKFLIVKKEIK